MRIITVRGIGESLIPHPNMLDRFCQHFPGVERYDLPWSAVYGPVGGNVLGESFSSAVERGEALLIDEIRKEPCIVVGYSGGAEVAGNVANRFHDHPNLRFVGLVADPSAPPNLAGDFGIRGYGDRWNLVHVAMPLRGNVRWVSNPDDVICCCPPDSPLRAIAETSEGFSLGDPKMWTDDLLKDLRRGTLWRWIFGDYRRYERAYRDACGYLGRDPINPQRLGRCAHTDYWAGIDQLARTAKEFI